MSIQPYTLYMGRKSTMKITFARVYDFVLFHSSRAGEVVLGLGGVIFLYWDFLSGSVVKNLPANAGNVGDVCSIPGLGRSSGEGNGNPLQCSCLENPLDRGAWRAAVPGVAKSLTRLSDCAHFCITIWGSICCIFKETNLKHA